MIFTIALIIMNIYLIAVNIKMIGKEIIEPSNNITPINDGSELVSPTDKKLTQEMEVSLPESESIGQRVFPNEDCESSDSRISLQIDLPKIVDEGEDAPPLLSPIKDGNVLGVFDGMGGAGAELYQIDNQKHTGAYYASRIVRDVVEQFSLSNSVFDMDIEVLSNSLKDEIKNGLQRERDMMSVSHSLLVSKMIKTLPTTMAVSYISIKENYWILRVLWAGDSRIYVLTPDRGLCQLTKDDLRIEQDPFQNLYNDSSLNNMVNLSQDFDINSKEYEFTTPCVVIAATDGCFGYYPSPMHFEDLLLGTMALCQSIEEWKLLLIEKLREVACDDCSMSLISNVGEFSILKNIFRERNTFISQELAKIETEINENANNGADKNAAREILEKHWAAYKVSNYPF